MESPMATARGGHAGMRSRINDSASATSVMRYTRKTLAVMGPSSNQRGSPYGSRHSQRPGHVSHRRPRLGADRRAAGQSNGDRRRQSAAVIGRGRDPGGLLRRGHSPDQPRLGATGQHRSRPRRRALESLCGLRSETRARYRDRPLHGVAGRQPEQLARVQQSRLRLLAQGYVRGSERRPQRRGRVESACGTSRADPGDDQRSDVAAAHHIGGAPIATFGRGSCAAAASLLLACAPFGPLIAAREESRLDPSGIWACVAYANRILEDQRFALHLTPGGRKLWARQYATGMGRWAAISVWVADDGRITFTDFTGGREFGGALSRAARRGPWWYGAA